MLTHPSAPHKAINGTDFGLNNKCTIMTAWKNIKLVVLQDLILVFQIKHKLSCFNKHVNKNIILKLNERSINILKIKTSLEF